MKANTAKVGKKVTQCECCEHQHVLLQPKQARMKTERPPLSLSLSPSRSLSHTSLTLEHSSSLLPLKSTRASTLLLHHTPLLSVRAPRTLQVFTPTAAPSCCHRKVVWRWSHATGAGGDLQLGEWPYAPSANGQVHQRIGVRDGTHRQVAELEQSN